MNNFYSKTSKQYNFLGKIFFYSKTKHLVLFKNIFFVVLFVLGIYLFGDYFKNNIFLFVLSIFFYLFLYLLVSLFLFESDYVRDYKYNTSSYFNTFRYMNYEEVFKYMKLNRFNNIFHFKNSFKDLSWLKYDKKIELLNTNYFSIVLLGSIEFDDWFYCFKKLFYFGKNVPHNKFILKHSCFNEFNKEQLVLISSFIQRIEFNSFAKKRHLILSKNELQNLIFKTIEEL